MLQFHNWIKIKLRRSPKILSDKLASTIRHTSSGSRSNTTLVIYKLIFRSESKLFIW
jgi:hypothetical protein